MFKRFFEISTLIVLILFFMVSSAFAFPSSINYQGKLTDSSGNLLNGQYSLTFMIYEVETWGTPLWIEDQAIIVTDGLYNAELGAVTPFPANLFETERLYLEVIIHNPDTGMDEVLSPRIPFNATSFSMKAKEANSVVWTNVTETPPDFADNTDNVDDADADPSNEIQTLSTSGNNISLSKGGGSVIAPYATNADMVDGKHAHELGGGDGHSLDAADGSPVDAVYVDNVGNVGIGTIDPQSKLHVTGPIVASEIRAGKDGIRSGGDIVWGGLARLTYNYPYHEIAWGDGTGWYFSFVRKSDGQHLVDIKDNGNVGIGTTKPNAKLDIYATDIGVGGWRKAIEFSHGDHSAITHPGGGLLFGMNAGAGTRGFWFGDYYGSSKINKYMMVLDAESGNVGIGTDDPLGTLHVEGPRAGHIFIGRNNVGGRIIYTDGDGNLNFKPRVDGKSVYIRDGNTNKGILLYGGGMNQIQSVDLDGTSPFHLSINPSGGNVGIGTTSPDCLLTLHRHSAPQLSLSDNVGSWQLWGGDNLHFQTDGVDRVYFSRYGNVGIGTTSPSQKLDVRGTVIANSYKYHSDSRLKKNIASIDNSLDKVLSLRGVEFEWRVEEYPEKGFAEGRKIGLIAQDVEQVIPEVVSMDNEGYKSVEYSNIVSVLVEAIKAQQAQIEELKARIEVLE